MRRGMGSSPLLMVARTYSSTIPRSSARASSRSPRVRRCSSTRSTGRRAPRREASSPSSRARGREPAVAPERSGHGRNDAQVQPREAGRLGRQGVWLMARRSPQSVLKRAREQAMREKRELKQAKKDARAAERRDAEKPASDLDAGTAGAE